MGIQESLPGGVILTSLETVAGLAREGSMLPATFGLA